MSRIPSFADLSLLTREEWSSAKMASEDAMLTLDPYPASIDGHVGGVIELPRGLSAAREFEVELLCMEFSQSSGSHDGHHSSASWQDIGTFNGKPRGDGGTDVPFCFGVPEDAPYTDSPSGPARTHHSWTLRIASTLASEDFERHWRIPVLACGQHASAAVAQVKPVVRAADTDAQLHLQPGSSGLIMDYPPGRTAATVPLLLGGAAVAFGMGWLFIAAKGELAGGILCWLFGLLVAGPGVWLLGNGLRVELRSGSLFITRSLFGLPVKRATVALSRIAGIACTKSGFSEVGADTKVYYRLVVQTSDGARHIVGDSIVGYGKASACAQRLAQLTGLKVLE